MILTVAGTMSPEPRSFSYDVRPGDDYLIYACKIPAAMNDYLVVTPRSDPQDAKLLIMSFYTKGGWGKMGGATPMQRIAKRGKTMFFKGEDISFKITGNTGKLNYFGVNVSCPSEPSK